ncbi:hypothetical protein NA57DRAFT_40015 [Rhizodiscina lignyota]|uniref:WD40 repeat-like protein n=1 Tax=Rhizodiscina lignyota TaxID=1504668 RepID=A0A9P4IA88_9PEZI|nr:hypothetical protein NA57DRAFT_40015 [Rhizodiscina lignyota]
MDGHGSPRDSGPSSALQSPTFDRDVEIRVNETVGSASISPSGRDVVLASREGLHIIDLDAPFSPPRYVAHRSQWEVADVQWSPFSSRDSWIVSTSNQKALVWNLNLSSPQAPIEHTLHAHSNAITDINFSAHHADILATCAVDSYVHCWDLRRPAKPVISFAEWEAGATQVKWNRQDSHIIATSHQRKFMIWDDRKGAHPVRKIEAHSTQIYGIDWNRLRPEALLTCSLDRTIKFWDYTKQDDIPERVIKTPYPVWRARHTPFGWGILAMPKRHDFNLYMYDRRLDGINGSQACIPPVCRFGGHEDQAKEFLWRSRGGVLDGTDNRDFQLVSWGMDRCLRLHRVDPHHVEAVGHYKGREVHKKLNLTRAGAVYRTFRDEQPRSESLKMPAELKPPRPPGLLGLTLIQSGMGKSAGLNNLAANAPAGMQARRRAKKAENTIDWMGGVKMGKAAVSGLPRNSIRPTDHQVVWDTPDSLSDEITYVGKKYKKVNFEHADVNRRTAKITLNGPWGSEDKSAFIRVTLKFPTSYPTNAIPQCLFEKTTSAISDETLAKLRHGVRSISDYYGLRRCGSLEAIVTYLLGERGLEDSLASFPGANGLAADESSSDDDDDDDAIGGAEDLEMSGTDLGSGLTNNANVPLPKACGAMFAEDGRLVCFFPPKPEPKPLFNLEALRGGDKISKGTRLFEEFGRYRTESPEPKESSEEDADDEDESSEGSVTSSSASSTSSIASEDIISALPSRFMPPAAWRASTIRFQKSSQHSSAGYSKKSNLPKPKSYISIVDTRDLLPAKKCLAEEYEVFGEGPSVCAHNGAVAKRHGLDDLAQVWELMRLILFNQVPLEILPQNYRTDPILVVARRAIARMKKKDSAIDLGADGDGTALTGRIKWGNHPLAGKWLIPRLFDHFEMLADTQMLGMMSCIFSEPAASQPVANALMRLKQQELPMSMKSPAFSLDYHASDEVAWSLFNRRAAPVTIIRSGVPTLSWSDPERQPGIYGSASSSNGPWSNDIRIPSDPVTPYSTDSTPPRLTRSNTMRSHPYPHSYSTSPDHHVLKRTHTNPFFNLAALNRPFGPAITGSPPTENRFQDDEADISTSAPASAVTWGETTFYSSSGTASASPDARRKSRHIAVEVNVRMTLKNQNMFDDEAHASVPLLDPADAAKYAVYRASYAEQLSVWDLPIARSEVLKFNGLTSYWPEEIPFQNSLDQVKSPRTTTQRLLDGVETADMAFTKKEKKQESAIAQCMICWQAVVGLHVQCTICGIGRAHKECAEEWDEELGDESWCNAHEEQGEEGLAQ